MQETQGLPTALVTLTESDFFTENTDHVQLRFFYFQRASEPFYPKAPGCCCCNIIYLFVSNQRIQTLCLLIHCCQKNPISSACAVPGRAAAGA